MNSFFRAAALTFTLIASAVAQPATVKLDPYPETPATPPEKAEAGFRVLDGFEMQLLAAEPLLTDPVAIAYDEFGRAYVAEMNDYPYTDKARHIPSRENPTDAPIGKVRVLEDSDNDGSFDKSTVLADGLSWPTGVACWKGGVYVIATPHLHYFKDTDGDGVADVRRKIYTGFRKLNVQAVINTAIWGLDHRIYFSGSTNGGELRKEAAPELEPLHMSRHDLSLDPVTETLSLESGYGRFGNTFDDYGNRFICNIRNPALHIVMPLQHAQRNPHLPATDLREDIAQFGEFLPVYRISPPEAWRTERAERWSREEPDRHPSTELVSAGAVTSSAGITIYRGDAYPGIYRGQLFVADVSSNLFYRLVLAPAGVTFKATRVDDKADFVASKDVWFRPVNLVNAPDGCLHVLDMYREAIEHPWSIPEDIHARIDLERGRDRGRIYRLAPPGFVRRPTPRLGDLSTTGLVALLAHENAWHRETAHRLLFERQDSAALGPLRALLAESGNPLGRIHALWSLAGLDALSGDEIMASLQDPSPAVREHAVRLAEPFALKHQGAAKRLANALRDPENRVRFRAVLSAAPQADEEHFLKNLKTLAREDGDDPWFKTAILASSTEIAGELLVDLMNPRSKPASRALLRDLASTVGARNDSSEVEAAMRALADPDGSPPETRVAVASGLAEGLQRERLNLFRVASDLEIGSDFKESILTDAKRVVTGASQPLDLRATALQIFRFTSFEEAVVVYAALLAPEVAPELQSAAIRSLSAFPESRVAEILVEAWPRLSPQVRLQALESLLTRPERLAPLLDAVEARIVSPHLITRARQDFLTNHDDPAIAAKAKTLFAAGARPREEIIARYRDAVTGKRESAEAGHRIYQLVCFACHKSGDEGISELGPNLSTVRQWDREQLLVNILDPNREISPAFIEYLIEKTDDSVVSGAVLNETGAAVLLRLSDGSRKWEYRRDIKSMVDTGMSLMPEGLEAVITPEQMADLVAYLTRP